MVSHKQRVARLRGLEEAGALRFMYSALRGNLREYHVTVDGQDERVIPAKRLDGFLDGLEAGMRFTRYQAEKVCSRRRARRSEER